MKKYMLLALVPILILFASQEADATSITFTTNTTITTDRIINVGETWVIESNVILRLDNVTITNNGQIINNGTIEETFDKSSIINNHNIIKNDGRIFTKGTINNYDTIENNGNLSGQGFGGIINNYDTIENNGGIEPININNNGTIITNGYMDTYQTAIVNHGLFINNGRITNEWGPIINYGNFTNNNEIINIDVIYTCNGTFINNGSLISLNGEVYENCNFCSLSLSDTTINIGESITASILTNDPISVLDGIIIKWIDPTNITKRSVFAYEYEDSFTPDMIGQWTVLIECISGEFVIQTFDVGFMVVPESVIGGIGVVSASIAVFSVYIFKRRNI